MAETDQAKRRIVDMDRFLVTKRNVLFWSAVLLAVEILHGTDAITPSALGANIAIPPSVLGIGLAAILTYHLVSFFIDRRQLLLENDDTGRPDHEKKIGERLAQLVSDVTVLSAIAVNKSKNLDAAFQSQKESNKILQDAISKDSHMRQRLIAVYQNIKQYNQSICNGVPIPMQEFMLDGSIASNLEAHIVAQNFAFEKLENEYLAAQEGVPSLTRELATYQAKVGKLSKKLDSTDRNLFIYWYTGLTVVVAFLAYCAMIVDVTSEVPISCKVRFLRSPSAVSGCPNKKVKSATSSKEQPHGTGGQPISRTDRTG